MKRELSWIAFYDVTPLSLAKLLGAVVVTILIGLISGSYIIHLLTTVCIYYIAMLGLNILVGLTGQLSLGQGAFVAIGAYTSALLTTRMGLPFGLAFVAAIIMSTIFGLVLALPTLRAKGFYFAVITLAFTVLISTLSERLISITNGDLGILSIPRPSFMGTPFDNTAYFYLVAISLIFFLILTKNLFHSRWGRTLVALKNNEGAASAVGVNIYRWKVAAFVVSSAYGGVAGSFLAHQSSFINSGMFTLELSISILIAIILGGVGSIYGLGLGALIIIMLPEMFAGFLEWHLLIYGAILVIAVIFMPEGIAGSAEKLRWVQRFKKPPQPLSVSNTDWLPKPISHEKNNSTVLRVKSISKDFGGLRALDDIDFEIESGPTTALIGPNGSGKTTLINVITGFYKPNKGSILFHDKDITHLPPQEMAALGISRTFQTIALFDDLTTLENVMLGFHHRIKTSFWGSLFHSRAAIFEDRQYQQKAMAILKAMKIDELAPQKAKNLPLGHRKLLEIARAWATEPDLLFLDEPAGGLSTSEIEHLSSILSLIRDRGTNMFLIEHRVDFVMNIAKKIIVFDYGKKISEGGPSQVQKDQKVIEAYLGPGELQITKQVPSAGQRKEGKPLLETEDMTVFYGLVEGVHSINIQVMPGEIVAVIGRNGAGKSSTLKGISGLAKATGQVSFENEDIIGIKPYAIARRGIVLVPEGRKIFGEHSVMDNLLLGHYRNRKKKAQYNQQLEVCFELFPILKERSNQRGRTLSGGEAQMLAIARGIMANPKILMLDEASLGLAPLFVNRIFETLLELNKRGITILLVEQMANMALRLADWGYVLETGRIKFEGTGEELLASNEIKKAYLGEKA